MGMSREEATERLKTDIYKYADFTENPNENEFWMAFDMAIKALEQEPYEDAANRQTAIDLVNSNMTFDEFESPTKKTKFHISDMDITFDKPLYQEEMEHLFFDALHSIGVKGHRGCPD